VITCPLCGADYFSGPHSECRRAPPSESATRRALLGEVADIAERQARAAPPDVAAALRAFAEQISRLAC
jgi:hypothetical protein